jgi:hypothetical protein
VIIETHFDITKSLLSSVVINTNTNASVGWLNMYQVKLSYNRPGQALRAPGG